MNVFRKIIERIRRSEEIRDLRQALVTERRRLRRFERDERLRETVAGRLVWVFGGGRSGTTWLANMMRDLSGLEVWFEPRVGELFDPYHLRFDRRGGRHFFFSEAYRDTWMGSVRSLILDGAAVRFPKLDAYSHLIAKEPSGSVGAVMLMEAVPESRIILLVRDPRDVVASWIDGMKEGSWSHERAIEKGRIVFAEVSAKRRAEIYFRNVSESKKAYDAHSGYKTLVRYEDLRADTLGVMERMFSEAGMMVDGAELARVVEAHSWERIPEDQKGKGKFYRKATAGGWRDDLTEDQAREVEERTGDLMDDLGYQRFYT